MAQDHHYQVTYYDKNGKADDSSKRFADEKKANAHAFRGNAIDKVGGKYKVHKVLSPIDEANDVPFDGPYTNTFKKKSNPNRTGMDAARSLAQRGISKAKVMAGNEKFSSSPDKLKKQHFGMSEDFTEEEVDEMINEVLSKDASAGDWISDFIKSDNPKFEGKSKEKRKQMALAAYYAKQRNEEKDVTEQVEDLDEKITVVRDANKVRSDAPQGRGDVHIPVAPVPHKKYIIGTPEWKAHKASRKPINGHPTNEEVEQIEEGDLSVRHLYNKFADAHVGGNDTKPTEKAIRKVHGDEVFKHMKKAANANAKGDMDGEERHFDNAQTAAKKTDRIGGTVGRGRSEFMRKRREWSEEAKDEKEYGYEGDMAMNQLKTLVRCAEMIEDCLKPDTDLPEWVQSKITLATDYIQTAADYLYSESEMNEEVESIDELSKTTLGSYVKKAKGSAIGNANAMGMTRQDSNIHKKAETKMVKRAKGIDKAVDRLTNEEHIVHVNDGSKYGEQPHDKDAEHVMTGVKLHGGEFDGHSDKGAFFKFKTAEHAKSFKRHVDSCPHKTCDADLHESNQNAKATVKTAKYSWGTMKTIHHGSSFSIPLHPEHHEHIAKMKDQQVHNIKTEDGRQWHVKREGDTVHFHGANGGDKTSVPHKSLAEENNKEGTMKSYKEFLEGLNEVKLADLPVRRIQGRSYGNQPEEPDHDEDDEVKPKEKAEKRGRGRPAGSKSGARQLGGASKKGSGVEYTGFKLHLPNSNR